MLPLLAKSAGAGKPGRTLVEHTLDVADAFVALFGTPNGPMPPQTERWVAFFKLDDAGAFLSNGLAAALFHDWGKANDGFQGMLERQGRQLVRHEHLSAMLLHLPVVRQWLSGSSGLDQDLILAGVVTHHLQASHETIGKAMSELELPMHVQLAHPDFRQLVNEAAQRLGLTSCPLSGVPALWSFEPQPGDFDMTAHLSSLKGRLSNFDDDLTDDTQRRRLLWAVRSALIAADAAGSGSERRS